MSLSSFHPIVSSWFTRRFGAPTEPQLRGWPLIRRNEHTLIAAPTGSGKTLAAFLGSIDELLKQALAGSLRDQIEVLYVSPLKALSSDVRRNLEEPLSELVEEAARAGAWLPPLRVGLRTGDTPPSERQALLRRPPHILVTTPESLYLYLTSARARATLAAVRTVIIDEIHALCRDKRGSHLSLSLERLDALSALSGRPAPTRIGLSATQHPIEEVARFLVGTRRVGADGTPACHIVDAGRLRRLDLAIMTPKDELGAVCTTEQFCDVHDQIARLIREHRTTLVFVSTRKLAERSALALSERLGEDVVTAHHGSLSRRLRQRTEERLKRGELKAVVATASLELGIDIGSVDLVCQIGSPRAIATLIQRTGRANHRPEPGEGRMLPPKGRVFALTRDELIECAALLRAVRSGAFDRLTIPEAPLDVLAQQLCAMCALDEWDEDAAYALAKGAWPYRGLSREIFDQVVHMLSEGVSTHRGRSSARLHRDQVGRKLRARRGTRMFSVLNGGTIPEQSDYEVVAEPEGTQVGRLEEDWVVESSVGDVFLLGTTSWRIAAIRDGKVHVVDARGQAPTVPFWFGEAPGRTFELSMEVSRLRRDVDERLGQLCAAHDGDGALQVESLGPLCEWLTAECSVTPDQARQIASYLALARAQLGLLPSQADLVAERFFDDAGGMQLVLHMPLGARINRAFGLSLRKRFCRSFNFELQAAATDDGVLLSLGEANSFPLMNVWQFLRSESVRHVLEQALLGAPLFGPHFRYTAQRSLALPRRRGGKKIPPQILRMYTEDLLAAVFPAQAACPENLPGGDIEIPDHPLVKETLRECLEDVMDVEGLRRLLSWIEAGQVRVHARDTTEPSVLSHQILNAAPYAFLDDAPLEERRSRAVSLRRGLYRDLALDASLVRLDPSAIAQVRREAFSPCASADELHDALLILGYLPEELAPPGWGHEAHLDALTRAGRLTLMRAGPLRAYVASERADMVRCLLAPLCPDGVAFSPPPPEIPWVRAAEEGAQELACVEVVRGFMQLTGPWSAAGLSRALSLPEPLVEAALLALESQGQVLRGHFLPSAERASPQFCDRRMLARIHRLTRARLFREIEPVSMEELRLFLHRWQHASQATRLSGTLGLRRIVAQLAGFSAPAAAWEEEIFPARMKGYDPAWLDTLCLSGEVLWGRLRPPRAGLSEERVRRGPTRSAPICLWLRQDSAWLMPRVSPDEIGLSPQAAAARDLLLQRGALFLGDLCAGLKRSEEEVRLALGELISTGLVSADGFAALRALIGGAPGGAGRFALLPIAPVQTEPGEERFDERLLSWTRLYLSRYGVVARDLLRRETVGPSFFEVLPVLRFMETRGEIRGGRFVAGLSGEHFALPEAVEGLRALRRRRTSAEGAEELAHVPAADPLHMKILLGDGTDDTPTEPLPLDHAVLPGL